MLRLLVSTGCLVGLCFAGAAMAALDCSGSAALQPRPVRPTGIPALAMELPGSGSQLGAPSGVLARAYDEMLSVDRVLLRLRLESCVSMVPAYIPRTQWDNKPWRFSAGGDGKKFSAAEFDTWMKSRGVRVVKGKTVVAPAAAVPVEAALAPVVAPVEAAVAPAAAPVEATVAPAVAPVEATADDEK